MKRFKAVIVWYRFFPSIFTEIERFDYGKETAGGGYSDEFKVRGQR